MAPRASIPELGSGDKKISALLFMQAGMIVLDAYSTLNSSPWTAESFGADQRRADALKEYVCHAAIYSSAYCIASAAIGETPWPLYGAAVNNAYLIWLYARASRRGREAGSDGWANDPEKEETKEAA